MTTAIDLLVILSLVSALYVLLGLLCGAVEGLQGLWARRQPHRRTLPATNGEGRRRGRRPRRRGWRRPLALPG
jgi:hypothetical protein